MEVENGPVVEETSLVSNRAIFHFHDYGRKSGLCQDFLTPVSIFEQIDGCHLHDFKYATLDASEIPISWYGCYIPGAGQPEVDTLPPWFTRSFLRPPDDFLSRQISESTIFMVTRPETNIAHENRHVPGKYNKNGGFSLAMLVSRSVLNQPPTYPLRLMEEILHQLIGI